MWNGNWQWWGLKELRIKTAFWYFIVYYPKKANWWATAETIVSYQIHSLFLTPHQIVLKEQSTRTMTIFEHWMGNQRHWIVLNGKNFAQLFLQKQNLYSNLNSINFRKWAKVRKRKETKKNHEMATEPIIFYKQILIRCLIRFIFFDVSNIWTNWADLPIKLWGILRVFLVVLSAQILNLCFSSPHCCSFTCSFSSLPFGHRQME